MKTQSSSISKMISRDYLAGFLLRVLAVAAVVLFIHTTGKITPAQPANQKNPAGASIPEDKNKVLSIDTYSLLEALQVPGCLVLSTKEPSELPFAASEAGLVIGKYDDKDSNKNVESVTSSTIAIILGGKDEIYRIRAL